MGQLKKPTNLDWAYLAGLIDGDGHIGVHPAPRNGFRSVCEVDITSYLVCKHLKGIFSGHLSGPYIRKNPLHKPMFQWKAKLSETKYILSNLLPFLILKKDRAQKVVDFIDFKNGLKKRHRDKKDEAILVQLMEEINVC